MMLEATGVIPCPQVNKDIDKHSKKGTKAAAAATWATVGAGVASLGARHSPHAAAGRVRGRVEGCLANSFKTVSFPCLPSLPCCLLFSLSCSVSLVSSSLLSFCFFACFVSSFTTFLLVLLRCLICRFYCFLLHSLFSLDSLPSFTFFVPFSAYFSFLFPFSSPVHCVCLFLLSLPIFFLHPFFPLLST